MLGRVEFLYDPLSLIPLTGCPKGVCVFVDFTRCEFIRERERNLKESTGESEGRKET